MASNMATNVEILLIHDSQQIQLETKAMKMTMNSKRWYTYQRFELIAIYISLAKSSVYQHHGLFLQYLKCICYYTCLCRDRYT